MPFGKLQDRRFADHPHDTSLQNVNLCRQRIARLIRLGEVVGNNVFRGAKFSNYDAMQVFC
jgi:hypothetical protein